MPDWNVAAIEARCVSGWENWRAYWIMACMSPMLMRSRRDLEATDHGDQDVLDVAHEQDRRLDQVGHELGTEARLVQLVVVGAEALLGLTLAAEALHDRMPGEHLLGLALRSPV
jgi:hypothetical protein